MDRIELRAGRSTLILSPRYGAAILRFSHNGQDMFKPSDAKWTNDRSPTQTSCFPLVPYSNRIRDGKFVYQRQIVNIAGAFADYNHALHGLGWTNPWKIDQFSAAHCVCTYRHEANQWPWSFTARQHITLGNGHLMMALSITNDSHTNMPAGLGFHPYFPAKNTAKLRFHADGVWMAGDDILPTEWIALPPKWNFSHGLNVAGMSVDHCFTGLGTMAQIDWTNARYGLDIHIDRAQQWAVVYVPKDEPYFCFEPVSHMNDAHNWAHDLAGTGLRSLPSGETLTVTTVFAVRE